MYHQKQLQFSKENYYESTMKGDAFFWRRFFKVGIDIAIIFGLANLLQQILFGYIFLSLPVLFAWVSAIYYLVFYIFANGQTASSVLVGLQLKNTNHVTVSSKQVFIRELLLKALIGILVPIFLIPNLFYIWSPILTIILVILVLLLSLIWLLVFKIAWWEKFSGTRAVKAGKPEKRNLLYSIAVVYIILLPVIWMQCSPLIKGKKQLIEIDYPKYPDTKDLNAYDAFLSKQSEDPVDYIFELFGKYDFGVLSERVHPEYSQYEFITKIVTDKRFVKLVGNLFTEQGSVNFQDTLNTYMHTNYGQEDSLNRYTALLERNSSAVHESWCCTNLFDILKTVHQLNAGLPDSNRIQWYFTDLARHWETTTRVNYLAGLTPEKRDSLMASHIIERINGSLKQQQRKKALIILNAIQGFGVMDKIKGIDWKWMDRNIPTYDYMNNRNCNSYLMHAFPGKVANVLINTTSMQYGPVFTPVQNGKWDAVFAHAGNKAVGFNFENSPFGKDPFDLFFCNPSHMLYKEVFTGFVFYKPLSEHIIKDGYPFYLNGFKETYLKRAGYVGDNNLATAKRIIAAYERTGLDTIDSRKMPYALAYNVITILMVPGLLLVLLLCSTVFFTVRMKQR